MNEVKLTVSNEILRVCPQFCLSAIRCKVKNTPHNNQLWEELEAFSAEFRSRYSMEEINKREAILATRQAYKNWERTRTGTGHLPKRFAGGS